MYAQINDEIKSDVAIVGGGYAGMETAIRLLRHARGHGTIWLFEKEDEMGGVGYAPNRAGAEHRLNLQAGRISLLREDPTHFLRWAHQIAHLDLEASSPVSRRIFSEYCWDTLWAEAAKCKTLKLKVCKGDATRFHENPEGVHVQFAKAPTLSASDELFASDENIVAYIQSLMGAESMSRHLHGAGRPVSIPDRFDYTVLATGHLEVKKPDALKAYEANDPTHHIIIDQYDPGAPAILEDFAAHAGPDEVVLILGTGLKAMDAALSTVRSFEAHKKPPPHIIFSSRHCQRHFVYAKDHKHQAFKVSRPALLGRENITLDELVAAMPSIWEKACAEIRAKDPAVVKNPPLISERVLKAMEPHIAELMAKMSAADVQAGLAKYGSLITSSRIGVVPEIGDVIKALELSGKAEFIPGKLTHFENGMATIRSKGEDIKVHPGMVINSIGQNLDYTQTTNPLWKSADFLPHQKTGIGVQCAPDGSLMHADGTPYKRVYCCGVMRQGEEIEMRGRTGAFSQSQGPIKNQAMGVAIELNRSMSLPFSDVERYYKTVEDRKRYDTGEALELFLGTLNAERGGEPLTRSFKRALAQLVSYMKNRMDDQMTQHLYAENYESAAPDVLREIEEGIFMQLEERGIQSFTSASLTPQEEGLMQIAVHILLEEGITRNLRKCMDITHDPQTMVGSVLARV